MKIIINADDLGLSYEVNKAIETAIIGKKISSSTILANGMAFDDAIRISKEYPNISYGVHLNLIEFRPLTNLEVFDSYNLINNQGNFVEGSVFCIKEFTLELKNAIYEEWMAQINKIKNTGILISHIDSHQHTHGIDDLKDVLSKVIYDSGVTKIRRQSNSSMLEMYLIRKNKFKVQLNNTTIRSLPKKNFLIRRLNQLINSVRHYLWIKQFKNQVTLTDAFISYGNYIYLFSNYYKWYHFDTIELMCHPGHKDYEHETESVMADKLSCCVDYQMITYNEL